MSLEHALLFLNFACCPAGNEHNKFAINTTTGYVNLVSDLDYENTSLYVLTVVARNSQATPVYNATYQVGDTNFGWHVTSEILHIHPGVAKTVLLLARLKIIPYLSG